MISGILEISASLSPTDGMERKLSLMLNLTIKRTNHSFKANVTRLVGDKTYKLIFYIGANIIDWRSGSWIKRYSLRTHF
jgi:hypothetical protein